MGKAEGGNQKREIETGHKVGFCTSGSPTEGRKERSGRMVESFKAELDFRFPRSKSRKSGIGRLENL